MALSRKFRLSDEREIRKIFRYGRSINSEFFQIKFNFSENNQSKFAVIARAKNFKNAASRNKIKRRISEIIRINISRVKPGFVILVIAKEKALILDKNSLKTNLLKDLGKLK
ncbi:MAG: ribonuclease P protein component [Patescibacteria group bacterium]